MTLKERINFFNFLFRGTMQHHLIFMIFITHIKGTPLYVDQNIVLECEIYQQTIFYTIRLNNKDEMEQNFSALAIQYKTDDEKGTSKWNNGADCLSRNENRHQSVQCRMWKLEDPDIFDKYKFKIVDKNSNMSMEIARSISPGDPYETYKCYPEHNVKKLSVIGRQHQMVIIQYETWKYDEAQFIYTKLVTVANKGNITYEKQSNEDICDRGCTIKIHELYACTQYTICITLKFVISMIPISRSCKKAKTLCRNKDINESDEQMKVLQVAVTIIGSVLVLIILVLIKKNNICQGFQKTQDDSKQQMAFIRPSVQIPTEQISSTESSFDDHIYATIHQQTDDENSESIYINANEIIYVAETSTM